MKSTVEKLLSFNRELFDKQKTVILVFVFVTTVVSAFKEEIPVYKKEDLQININTATKQQLLSIPYIKEKTAERILSFRKKKGRFSSIEDLNKIRNFQKFKYFIKAN